MAEKKLDSKLSELLSTHYEAVGEYLKRKEKFKKAEEKYDKETHEQRKKALEELKKDLKVKEAEEKNYLAALDKIIKEKNKYDEQDIADFKEAKNSILAAQKYSNIQLEEAVKEEAELTTKGYNEKWTDISDKTQKYTQVGADALGKMFTGMTKYMDETIAKRKKEIEEITKQVSQIQKDLAFEQKKADETSSKLKSELLKEEGEKEGGNAEKMQTELDEMQTLHNLKAELDAENEKRKEEEGYQNKVLTDDQSARYDRLKNDHATYAASLEAKTNLEKNA